MIKFPTGTNRFGAWTSVQDVWATFTASSTVTFLFPAYYRRTILERVSILSGAALTGTGVLTCTVRKISAGVSTTLTAAFDCKGLAANVAQRIPLLTTLTDANRLLQDGDVLVADFIAGGTVVGQTTQGVSVAAEWDVLG